jgi:hypothetical protein
MLANNSTAVKGTPGRDRNRHLGLNQRGGWFPTSPTGTVLMAEWTIRGTFFGNKMNNRVELHDWMYIVWLNVASVGTFYKDSRRLPDLSVGARFLTSKKFLPYGYTLTQLIISMPDISEVHNTSPILQNTGRQHAIKGIRFHTTKEIYCARYIPNTRRCDWAERIRKSMEGALE